MKKILLIVVVLIILLVGGFFFWIETHTNKSNSSTNKEQITNRIQDEDVKNSIFKDYYKEATKVVSKMTLEEKVGQLFLVRYDKNTKAIPLQPRRGGVGKVSIRNFQNAELSCLYGVYFPLCSR